MRVLGICGSPRPQGNSAYALHYALDILQGLGLETEYISLAERTIHPCDGCFRCRSGPCPHQDDMPAILDALRRCDGLILASPVYKGMVTGQMKVMMYRTVCLRVGGQFALTGKVGTGIACGGFRNGGQELTLQNMQTYFLQQNMLALADGPGFSHSGATIVGKAQEDELGLRTVRNLAEHLARTLALVRGSGV